MTKYRIKRKQATLYVESEISKNAIWLKKKMAENKEYPHLTRNEYNLLDDSQKRYIDNRFGELLRFAISEWVVEYDRKEKNENQIINCELCGEKNIKYISKIKNPKNNKSLIVGSSCITDYSEMKDAYGKTLSQLRKESSSTTNKILKNEEILEKRIPNILNNIDTFNKIMYENEYIIRTDIEKKYEYLNKEINNKYNKYLKLKKINEEKLLEIENINSRVLEFIKKINEYIEECDNDVYGIDKNISRWCYSNPNYNLLSKLKKDGKITKDTISQIKEPKFLEKIILEFKDLFTSNNIHLKNNNIGKYFKASINDCNIYIDIDSSNFIDDYKDYLYGEKNIKINKDDLINDCIISDKKSLDNSLQLIINSNVSKSQYKYKFSDISLNEISFYNKIERKFYVLKYREFINTFKICILKDKVEKEVKKILDYISKNSEIYSYSDYKEH